MFKITQRQAVLFSLAIQLLATLFLSVFQFITVQKNTQKDLILTVAVTVIYAGLLALYRGGWDPARHVAVVFFTLILALSLPEPFVSQYAPMVMITPLVLALVVAEPIWLLGIAFALWFILLARANFQGVYANPVTLGLYFMIVAGLLVSRLVVETARRQAEQQARELRLAYDATIEGWSHALDLRDKETEGHSQRVTSMSVRLARSMRMSEEELVHVRRGALLHDIGKLSVPDGILLKPGPLTDDEWVVMKKHPIFSYEMLSPIHYLQPALDIPYCHHEKWDGSGYPRGLKGVQIPLVARIFAVVDVWDALSSDRPYRAKWAEEKVREHIRSSSRIHFDPQVVEVFMQLLYLLTGHW